MTFKILAALLLACPALARVGSEYLETPGAVPVEVVGHRRLNITENGFREQDVTHVDGAPFYERLGTKPFRIGVGFQAFGLVALLIGVLAQLTAKVRAKMAMSRADDDDDDVNGPECILKVVKQLLKSADFAKFILTALSYVILDNLYMSTFVGADLTVFTINATCTGMECDAPYGVIASNASNAIGEACHQFQVHNPQCSEAALLLDPSLTSLCRADPLLLVEVYFSGYSRKAMSLAFVLGCMLSALLSIADLVRLFGGGWVITGLMGVIKPKVTQNVKTITKTKTKMLDNYHMMADAVVLGSEEKTSLRIQNSIRMALDGLAYGLMMMVLEVQVDDGCVEMRAMLPITVSSTFAYVVIGVTCLAGGVFMIVGLFERLAACMRCFKKDCMRMEEPGCALTFLSYCFIALVFLLLGVSFVAYFYSVVLSVYLAYQVPNDSAVILGCCLATLALLTQLIEIYEPQPQVVLYHGEGECLAHAGAAEDPEEEGFTSQYSEDQYEDEEEQYE